MMLNGPINRWCNVFAGALGTMAGAGIFAIYGFGVLAKSISADMHWPRSLMSEAMTVFMLTSGLGSAALGWLIGRFGIRGPAIAFVAAFALILALIGVAPLTPLVFLELFGALGVAGAGATALPYATAVSGWFDENRGIALGLINAAGGFAGVIGPGVALWLVAHHGWRGGFRDFALIFGPAPILGLLFAVRTPPEMKTIPFRGSAATGWTRELGKSNFWLIGAAIAGIAVASFGVLSILPPLLTDRGMSAGMAAGVLSMAGLSSWGAKFLSGYLIDRVFAPRVAAGVCLLMTAGLVLILVGGSGPAVYLGTALMGLGVGSEADLLTYLLSRYFELRIFSRLVGLMWVMWAWGQGAGSLIAGVAFKATGRYDEALWTYSALLLLAAALISRLPPYRFAGKSLFNGPAVLSVGESAAPV